MSDAQAPVTAPTTATANNDISDLNGLPLPRLASTEVAVCDALVANQPLRPDALWTLMQRAGQAAASWLMEQYDHNPVRILCGPGNNGGDGWIMAAALRAAGWPVLVSALPPRSEFCQKAHALAQTAGVAEIPLTQKTAPNLVVDAVFGAGFRDVVPPKT